MSGRGILRLVGERPWMRWAGYICLVEPGGGGMGMLDQTQLYCYDHTI